MIARDLSDIEIFHFEGEEVQTAETAYSSLPLLHHTYHRA